jgi:hypothetical protein
LYFGDRVAVLNDFIYLTGGSIGQGYSPRCVVDSIQRLGGALAGPPASTSNRKYLSILCCGSKNQFHASSVFDFLSSWIPPTISDVLQCAEAGRQSDRQQMFR